MRASSFSPDEAEAFLHLWKVVGHYMGVDPRLLPRNVADGEALMEHIRATQWQASPEGAQLATALVGLMSKFLPGRALDGLPIAMMRELAGDHCADLLGLPQAGWTCGESCTPPRRSKAGSAPATTTRSSASSSPMRRTGCSEGLVNAFRLGKQTKFRIPPALMHKWDLND